MLFLFENKIQEQKVDEVTEVKIEKEQDGVTPLLKDPYTSSGTI